MLKAQNPYPETAIKIVLAQKKQERVTSTFWQVDVLFICWSVR
jgi:hypothetical protein